MNSEFQFEDEDSQQNQQEDENIVQELQQDFNQIKMEPDTAPKQQEKQSIAPQEVKVKFIVLVRFFLRMVKIRGRRKQELLSIVSEHFFKANRNPTLTYTVMRLLIPFQDRDRGVYKLQEKALAKLFRDALGLQEDDYQRMANYKHAAYQPYGAPVGDFPLVVHNVIYDYCRKDPVLSISDVDRLLDELVQAQDSSAQVKVMIKIIQHCTADEIMWIIRIILKDLKIGLKYEKVLEMFHPDAPEYYNATSSLREVCKEFENPNHSLKNVLRLFHPIKPMLAAKKTPDEIRSILAGKEFLIETKYDGERIQCHFTPDQIRFFTRNSNDYTHVYKEKMADIIRQCVSAQSAILDGEIVVVDRNTGECVRFGMNKTVAKDVEDETYRLCYKIFDILYIKGQKGEECNMMNLKLSDRRKVLQRIIKPVPNHLELVYTVQTDSFEQLVKEFDKAIQKNEEGIIIKQIETEYHPNDRSTKWVKMKGDYVEDMTDNCDLLVVGGFFGTESHRVEKFDIYDRITHFLMGLAQKIDKNNPNNSLFLPFVKVGTGFTDIELSTIRNKLRTHWVLRDSKTRPGYLPASWNPGINDRPDVYIDNPAHSIIFEIKAAEITKSNTFPTDYTLRFPRCYKTRWDKEWYEVMTQQDLQHMINDTQYTKNLKKKNDSGGSQQGSEDEVQGERPMRKAKQKKQPQGKKGVEGVRFAVMQEFLGVDKRNITKESNLFFGCEFLVANIDEDYNKQYLETLIIQNGGSCVQNFIVESVTHVIASKIDFRISTIIEKYPTPIIRPAWIIECVRRVLLVNIAPRFILTAPFDIILQMKQYYDQFGDSYLEDIDEQALMDICETMDVKNEYADPKEIAQLEDELLQDMPRLWPFDGQRFHLYASQYQISNEDLELLKLRLKARGASIAESLDEHVDYIVLFPEQSFIQDKQLEIYLGRKPYMKTTSAANVLKLLN